jgi:hypothetical protein
VFLAAECGPKATPGIRTLYRDDETGYNVLVRVYEKGKSGPPHDHGASWAVYGQATEWTDMTLWKRLDDGADDASPELVKERSFRLNPGMAGTFEVGQIHCIHFPDGGGWPQANPERTGGRPLRLRRVRFAQKI